MMLSNINNNGDILIECFCGCGKLIPCIDERGRPRRYFLGHNRRKKRVMPEGVMVEISKINSLSMMKEIALNQSKMIYELRLENEEQRKELEVRRAIIHHLDHNTHEEIEDIIPR